MNIRSLLNLVPSAVVRLFVAFLSLLVPKDKDLWAFGSGMKTIFSDNAKWLYLYCNDHQKIRPVWIASNKDTYNLLRDRNLPVQKRGSVCALWTALRAGVYVYDVSPEDVNYAASRGALLVNLWHGTPLKTIGLDNPSEVSSNILGIIGDCLVGNKIVRSRFFWMFRPITLRKPDILACTSDTLAPIFMRAFGIERTAICISGYPRNDALFSDRPKFDEPDMAIINSILDRRGRIIFYLPTFRDSGASYLIDASQQIKLEATLKKFNCYLVLKLHPKDATNFEPHPDVDHILSLSSDLDIYTVLDRSIALITDYSSVMFDYLLLNRPMIFYCHDLDRYQAQDRKMYFNYEDVTPGSKAYTFEELETLVEDLCAGKGDQYVGRRQEVRRKLHQHIDGRSSLRIFEAIRERQANDERSRRKQKRIKSEGY